MVVAVKYVNDVILILIYFKHAYAGIVLLLNFCKLVNRFTHNNSCNCLANNAMANH